MRNVRCPNCNRNDGTQVDSELLGPEVNRTFECEQCGHTWDTVV